MCALVALASRAPASALVQPLCPCIKVIAENRRNQQGRLQSPSCQVRVLVAASRTLCGPSFELADLCGQRFHGEGEEAGAMGVPFDMYGKVKQLQTHICQQDINCHEQGHGKEECQESLAAPSDIKLRVTSKRLRSAAKEKCVGQMGARP